METSLEIVNTLEGAVERLKVICADRDEVPLDDNVAEVRHLCVTVEEVLRYHQKDKVSFWGERKDYWTYLSEVVSNMKSLDGCVKRVQGLPQLTTGQGKGRALIRECLTEHLLADCIQNSLSNSKRTKEWYQATSIFLTDSLSQRVLNALYDLSDVTFDLSSEGLDLDETWPSFVLKSFQNQNGTSEIQNQTKSPIMKVLGGSTLVAKVADKGRPKPSHLERAIEEEPTEIFVRHEIPFDLVLVGTLLADIQDSLTTFSAHTLLQPQVQLPQLKVNKMDDITSCLDLLKGFMGAWSRDLSAKGNKMVEENRALKDKQTDLELQLRETIQESENSETDLVDQLQLSREEIKSFSLDMQRLTEENQELSQELATVRDKLRELEAVNFDLEEQLVRCSPSESEERVRERAYTVLESTLQEKDQDVADLTKKVEELDAQNQQLQRDLSDAQTNLQNQSVLHEVHRRSEVSLKQLQDEMQNRGEAEAGLKAECEDLHSQNQSLTAELQQLRGDMEQKSEEARQETSRMEQELITMGRERDHKEQERDHARLERDQMRQDWDSVKAELENAGNMVDDATSSLKFKLSSQSIELQQAKEQASKKDQAVSELNKQLSNMQSQLEGVSEHCQVTERQLEEARVELKDIETILRNNQDEMSSLHEQLTEKTLSRDQEREAMLKSQLQWESAQLQLSTEKAELRRQVDSLSSENDEIRRALQKLLEQKVTLWQHADDLEQEQTALGMWLDSKLITECMNCSMTFTVFARKHHCRSCGKVYCTKCCEKKLQLAVSKDPARVCDNCYKRVLQKRLPFASAVVNDAMDDRPHPFSSPTQRDKSPISQDEPSVLPQGGTGVLPLGAAGVSSNSLNIERTVDLSGNSLHAKLLVQNQDSALTTPSNASPRASPQRPSRSLTNTLQDHAHPSSSTEERMGQEEDIKPSSYRSVNSMEYSVDPVSKRREVGQGEESTTREGPNGSPFCSDADTNYHLSSVQGETIDECYYIVDTTQTRPPQETAFPVGLDDPGSVRLDVDALASKLASLEGSRVANTADSAAGGRRGSVGSGMVGCVDMTEVMLEGGAVHKVGVAVEKHGTAIVWEFSTEPKGIAFGICYRETKTSTREDEVLPLKRCVSHKATLTGEYSAQKKGIYVLKFDNRHSKFSGRKLLFKVWTRPPS